MILNLLHANVVHLTFGEGVGLLGRTSMPFPFFALGHSVAPCPVFWHLKQVMWLRSLLAGVKGLERFWLLLPPFPLPFLGPLWLCELAPLCVCPPGYGLHGCGYVLSNTGNSGASAEPQRYTSPVHTSSCDYQSVGACLQS